MHLTYILSATGLFAASLAAQSGPAQHAPGAADTYLSNAPSTPAQPTLAGITLPAPIWLGGSGTFQQVNATKSGIENLKPGEFALTFTTTRLNPFYHPGTTAVTGVILGKFDTNGTTPVFTPTDVAKNMNGAGTFGLMIEPRDGLFATVDWSGGPMIGYRARRFDPTSRTDVPFDTPIAFTGATLGTYVDPAVCYVDGQLSLLYVGSSGIGMRSITATISNGQLTAAALGAETTVATTPGLTAHSPSPIIDAAGNTQGLFLCGVTGSDSDLFYQSILENINPTIKLRDTTSWQNNGGTAGGTFFFRDTASSATIWRIDGAYMVGSTTRTGGTATITVYAKSGSTVPVVTTTLAVSTSVGKPVQIPGWVGEFALGTVVIPFASASATDRDEMASVKLPVPNDPKLKGVRLPIQGLANAATNLPPALTNTSYLSIK